MPPLVGGAFVVGRVGGEGDVRAIPAVGGGGLGGHGQRERGVILPHKAVVCLSILVHVRCRHIPRRQFHHHRADDRRVCRGRIGFYAQRHCRSRIGHQAKCPQVVGVPTAIGRRRGFR